MKFLAEIDGTNKLKQDPNNRLVTDEEKANFHGHENLAVLNDLTDSGGSLRYKGVNIGGNVPNLTLTALTLGNYRIFHNTVNDTLVFEYTI